MEIEVTEALHTQIQMLCDTTTTTTTVFYCAQRRLASSLTASSIRFASQSPQPTKSPSTFGGQLPINQLSLHYSIIIIIIIETIDPSFFITRLYWI